MNEEPNIPAFLCFLAAFIFAYGAYMADMMQRSEEDEKDDS